MSNYKPNPRDMHVVKIANAQRTGHSYYVYDRMGPYDGPYHTQLDAQAVIARAAYDWDNPR